MTLNVDSPFAADLPQVRVLTKKISTTQTPEHTSGSCRILQLLS
jgi:hypothetical protein